MKNSESQKYSKHYKVGFLGGGNIARAMISGFLHSQTLQAKNIFVASRSPEKVKRLVKEFSITSCSNEALFDHVSVAILCVKPQDFLTATDPIRHCVRKEHLVLSVMAGICLSQLKSVFQEARNVVRLMLDISVEINQSNIAYCRHGLSVSICQLIEDLFSPLGCLFPLEDEKQLKPFTVGSASGLGFVFELLIYWRGWLLEMGFSEAQSEAMVLQTFKSAVSLKEYTKYDLERVQSQIASRKGVTEKGLEILREFKVEDILNKAFDQALIRSEEFTRIRK